VSAPNAASGRRAGSDKPGRAHAGPSRAGTVEEVYGGDTCEEADHARKYHEPVVVLGSQTGQDSEHAVHAYRVLFWRMVAATRVLPVKTGRPTLDILNGALAFVWNGAHLIVAPSQADSSRPRESGFLNIR